MKWAVRFGGLVAIGVAVLTFVALQPGCSATGANRCPAFALQDPWILRGERSGAALLGVTFLVLVVCRIVVQGQLPDRVGRDGAEWGAEALSDSQQGIAGLKKIVGEHAAAIAQITESVSSSMTELAKRVDGLARQVEPPSVGPPARPQTGTIGVDDGNPRSGTGNAEASR